MTGLINLRLRETNDDQDGHGHDGDNDARGVIHGGILLTLAAFPI